MNSTGIRISGLTHSYGLKTALDDVNFEIAQGSFCALLGPNGAGKSTLFSLLCRLLPCDKGSIEIAGTNLSLQPRSALAKMGIVFQQPTLDLDLTIRQNLLYFAGLHGIGGNTVNKRIDAALDRLQMRERLDEKVRNLNGGHRRRMEIARALIHDPSVLLLDEPTVGLDAQTRRQITEHVHDLSADEKLTVLWSTHLVDEVRDDDRLVILHKGRVLKDGNAEDISDRHGLAETFAELTDE